MRIVTLEEHISFPEITAKIPAKTMPGHVTGMATLFAKRMEPALSDITGKRLQSMDNNGISTMVLSVTGEGADLLGPDDSPAFATEYNDLIASKIADHPDRFKAFAHLPTPNPGKRQRMSWSDSKNYQFCGALINGLTNDEFLDDQKYAPILETAQRLDVPIYLHPGLPPKAVAEAYYSDLPKYSGMMLSIAGWGWHSETALHVLRLVVSGTFDKYPRLKLIIGHMGEMLPMMMARSSRALAPGEAGLNERTVTQTLRDQVHITTSGLFTLPPLQVAIDTFGIDNVLFSVVIGSF